MQGFVLYVIINSACNEIFIATHIVSFHAPLRSFMYSRGLNQHQFFYKKCLLTYYKQLGKNGKYANEQSTGKQNTRN